MNFWTLDRVSQALVDEVEGARPAGAVVLASVQTDTRTLQAGDVFVALRGERHDAHDFLDDAVARGAAALVVSDARRAASVGVPVFVVRDTTVALGALARFRRRAWGGPVVAVAGSNGKTTTKELIAAALRGRFEVHATRGNLNNQVGVPLTLLALRDDADVAIVEVGTNRPGEVETLRAIAEPEVAVVTSIGEEHLEGFGDVDAVLREECAIFPGAALAITPAAQPEVAMQARSQALRTVEAGTDGGDVHPDRWGLAADGRGWMVVGDVRVELSIPGAHNLRNATLALAVARAMGVPDDEAAHGMSTMRPVAMRSSLEAVGTLLVLSDAYNANPPSTREAIAMLDTIETDRPRVAILGSMLELGAAAPQLHDEIARLALASRATVVAGVGDFADAFRRVAPGDARVITAPDAEALWPLLRPRLAPHAFVLLKGSRGTRLERLLPLLREVGGLDSGDDLAAPH